MPLQRLRRWCLKNKVAFELQTDAVAEGCPSGIASATTLSVRRYGQRLWEVRGVGRYVLLNRKL